VTFPLPVGHQADVEKLCQRAARGFLPMVLAKEDGSAIDPHLAAVGVRRAIFGPDKNLAYPILVGQGCTCASYRVGRRSGKYRCPYREADQRHVGEIEMRDRLVDIIDKAIVVESVPGRLEQVKPRRSNAMMRYLRWPARSSAHPACQR